MPTKNIEATILPIVAFLLASTEIKKIFKSKNQKEKCCVSECIQQLQKQF